MELQNEIYQALLLFGPEPDFDENSRLLSDTSPGRALAASGRVVHLRGDRKVRGGEVCEMWGTSGGDTWNTLCRYSARLTRRGRGSFFAQQWAHGAERHDVAQENARASRSCMYRRCDFGSGHYKCSIAEP